MTEEVTYKRYARDIPKRTRKGKIATEIVDGEYRIIYEHRKGDIKLDSEGNPIPDTPYVNPIPNWFTKEFQERPRLRYCNIALHYRSPEGIKDALKGLSDADLADVLREAQILSDARFQGTGHQLIRSTYIPTYIHDSDGDSQVLLYNDDGEVIEALPETVYNEKYADNELY